MCGTCCRKSPVSILPHEDIILKYLAGKLDVEYYSTPGYKVFDNIRKSYIAFSYVMHLVDDKCPFLSSDNKCLINDIYKPLICRSYPYVPKYVKYNIIWEDRLIIPEVEYGISIHCPVIEMYKSRFNNTGENEYLVKRFLNKEYRNAMEMEYLRHLLLSYLSNLWRRNIVKLVDEDKPYSHVINLYDVIREYFPEIPFIIGLHRVLSNIGEIHG